MDNHTLPINFQLNNKYNIKKVLGQGGFGITYLAEDTFLDIEVCIKELFVTGSSTRGANMTVMTHNMKDFSFADFKERFIQEAKQLAKFKHPNIVRVQDFFEANNTAYVVMEYIEGQTLKDKVAYGGPLSADASQKIIESILDAVEVVHKAGMLHRDIKPDNLIIGDDGRVVLIDFGSARNYSDERTIAQTAMVSPGYAPLEQYNPTDRKGTFTDIYSIGATFYFMLTGEKPLNVTNRYSERLKAPHEINPNVSMQVSSAVMLAMEMKAEDRFQNVEDFRLALQQMAGGQKKKEEQKTVVIPKTEIIKTESPKTVQNPETGKKNNNVLIFSVIGVVVLVLILLGTPKLWFAERNSDMSKYQDSSILNDNEKIAEEMKSETKPSDNQKNNVESEKNTKKNEVKNSNNNTKIEFIIKDLGLNDVGNPYCEILLYFDGKSISLDTVHAPVSIFNRAVFEHMDVPSEAISVCGGWWAGAGDYFYVIPIKNGVRVFGGWQDEGQGPDDRGYHWKKIKDFQY